MLIIRVNLLYTKLTLALTKKMSIFFLISDVPLYKLLLHLGRNFEEFVKEHPFKVQLKLANEVWSLICRIENKAHFMKLIDQWMPFIVPHLTVLDARFDANKKRRILRFFLFQIVQVKTVDQVLNDMQKYLAKETFTERIHAQMESIVRNLTDGIEDFMSLLIVVSVTSLRFHYGSKNERS